MTRARAILAALAALALPAGAVGGETRPWYVPDHAKLQLAGNVGFLSPGAGYALARRLQGDVFFGWVPEAIGGTDIFSVTGKIVWAPWSIASPPWSFRPLTGSAQLTYTFGDRYYIIPSELFVPTALRGGIGLGTEVSRRVAGRSIGIYAELIALDMALAYWLTNTDAIHPQDVFSFALGTRLDF